MNNTLEEKDYDLGLPEEEEGVTYYICYCPEDDNYLQGTDCEGQGYLAYDAHHLEMDECQEAVEEWTEPGPGDSPKACPPAEASCGPSRQECRTKNKGRPKSLNLPPKAKHPADAQRSFKTKTRTLEERPKWPQEEVRFWLALGKRREGARAKVSVQPTDQNSSQLSTCSVMCELHPLDACSKC